MATIDSWTFFDDSAFPTVREIEDERRRRLALTYRVATRTWREYRDKPRGIDNETWDSIARRYSVTDLLTPAIQTIASATYGGEVRRVVDGPYADAVAEWMDEAHYAEAVMRFFTEAALYGTAWLRVDAKERTLLPLPVQRTKVETGTGNIIVKGRTMENEADKVFRPNTGPMGFSEIQPGYGRHIDAHSHYGESLVWPAVEETRQVTYLMNDLMVLEKNQSFSVLVVRGGEPRFKTAGQHPVMIFEEDGGDAKYITPEAKISEINELIEAKFRRCAAQCSVPVEIFGGVKSGANQAAGAAYLTHKPLFDLVTQMQTQWKRTERELIWRIACGVAAMSDGGGKADYDKVRALTPVDVEFELESNPRYTQAEAQTWVMLRDAGLVSAEKAWAHFNDGDEEMPEAPEPLPELGRIPVPETEPEADA